MPVPFVQELLYTALADTDGQSRPVGSGIVIECLKPDTLKTALYRERRELQSNPSTEDPRLDCLTIRASPRNPSGELWIIVSSEPPKPNGAVES